MNLKESFIETAKDAVRIVILVWMLGIIAIGIGAFFVFFNLVFLNNPLMVCYPK